MPTQREIEEYRRWLVNRFEQYGEVIDNALTPEESEAIELDRR